eukprot:s8223_g2.t1
MEVNGKHFVVRASVVDGEVPLLLSRNALSRLGMIYDIENHTAQFKHLGIDHFKLLTTDNGHPAIQVNPSGFTGQKLPTPQEWDDDEVKIFSARPQYTAHTVHMTSETDPFDRSDVFETRGNKFPPGGPLGQLMPKIFYPKKIDASVQNMLRASPLNSDLFAAWWGRTPISKDFWIETTSALVRVHVVPRRGFFDPTQWTTHQQNVKQDLLRVIGEVRSTSAVSCTSLRAMQSVHDAWKTASDTSHPVLWIGRTIFSRASCSGFAGTPPSREKPSGTGNGVLLEPGGERVAHEQDPTPGEGVEHGDHDTSLVECGRAAAADPGKQEGDGLASMNKTQLLEQCRILELAVPEKATNGLLTLMIRDSCTKNKGDAVVTFGRHRGKLYKEVPRSSYLEWAIQEVRQRGPEGSSPDLVSLSTYAAQILQDKGAYHRDPEETAVVPIPPESSSASSWSEVWSEMTPPAGELNKLVEHANKPKSQMPVPGYKDSERATPTKRTPDRSEREGAGTEKMNQDVPPRAGGGGGSHGQIGFATRQVQPLRGCGSGTYESEGEPTEGQQGSPDGLKVSSDDVVEGDECTSETEKFFDCQENAVSDWVGSDTASTESRARELLVEKDFSFESCEKLLESVRKLSESSRKRKINASTCSVAFGAYSHGNHYGIIQKTYSFWHACKYFNAVAFGAYSHGNHYGIIQKTYSFWHACKYFNAFMRHHGAKGQWSSIQLGYNCRVGPHKDVHNLHSSMNWAISFGDFTKGRLWLECALSSEAPNKADEFDEIILPDGSRAPGFLHDNRCNMLNFSLRPVMQ